jgi:hypothetical protein
MTRQKAPARNDRQDPNLFCSGPKGGSKGKVKGRKRGRIKSKTTMRVGGRKVSAAIKNTTRYKFPVIVTTINEAKSATAVEEIQSVPDRKEQ